VAVDRFVTLTAFAALLHPVTTEPKSRFVGERLTGFAPDPVSGTVCVPALSTIVSVPEAAPSAAGVNVTEIVHHEPAAMLPLQVLVWLNGPLALTLLTCSGPVPELLNVTLRALLVAPRTVDWKERLAGDTDAAGVVPVPVRTTVCRLPILPESSPIARVPLTEPGAVGVNVTVTLQLAPTAN